MDPLKAWSLTRKSLVLFSLIIVGCADPSLVPVAPCVTGESRACVVPPCQGPGIQKCLEGEWGPCGGHQTPTQEMCNGRDDDCDGRIDNNPRDPEIGRPCGSNVGRCRKGKIRCVDGSLTCFGQVDPGEEQCNGLDDDCDGLVDNNLSEELCYTGPLETRGVGICHSGLSRCIDGRMVCAFEQTPLPFDCTNGRDNDCDGVIDREDETFLEIVLFVDWSGSMVRTLSRVREGLLRLVDLYRDSTHVRVATVVFPDERNDGECAVLHGLFAPREARTHIERLTVKQVGIEPSYGCMFDAASGAYGFDYRDEARIAFVLFTDEQSSGNDLTQEDVASAMNDIGATSHFFVDTPFQRHYSTIVELTGGTMNDLWGENLAESIFLSLLSQTCSM